VLKTGDVMEVLEGRVTYRQVDYWIRAGYIAIADTGRGQGNRRTFTPQEVAALLAYVDLYEHVRELDGFLRDGSAFRGLLLQQRPHLVTGGAS
jgi:DNA-binding transcriptional MerR regulator